MLSEPENKTEDSGGRKTATNQRLRGVEAYPLPTDSSLVQSSCVQADLRVIDSCSAQSKHVEFRKY